MAERVADIYVALGLRPDASWKQGSKLIGGLRSAMTGLVAFAGAGAITKLITDTGKFAVHTKALSQQMGVSTESVQEWGYVAEQAGSNVDELSIGMVRFAKNMRALGEGRNTIGTRALKAVGIDAKTAKHALTSSDGFNAAIDKVADSFLKMGNTGNRAGLSNELFGRQAKSMVSDLARGSKALHELKAAIRARGAIISNKEIEDLALMGNQINNVKQELHSFAYQAVGALAPALSKMIMSATQWIATHRELLKDVLGKAVELLTYGFKGLAKVVITTAHFIEDFKKGLPYATSLVYGLAAAFLMLKLRATAMWLQTTGNSVGFVGKVVLLISLFQFLKDKLGTIPAVILTIGTALSVALGAKRFAAIGTLIQGLIKRLITARAVSGGIQLGGAGGPGMGAVGKGGKGGGGAVGILGALGPAGLAVGAAKMLSDATDKFDANGETFFDRLNRAVLDKNRTGSLADATKAATEATVTNGDINVTINGVTDAVDAAGKLNAAIADIMTKNLRPAHRAAGGR